MNHLNKLVFLSLACYLSACDAPTPNQTTDTVSLYADSTAALLDSIGKAADASAARVDSVANTVKAENPGGKHKFYASISEMVEELGDFSSENGTFKIISQSPLHIQISNQTDKNGKKELMKKIAMQEIVYVAYEAFATTNISKITITSVPSDIDEFTNNHKLVFINEAATTITITKEKARQVMQSHLGTTNFDDMIGVHVGDSYFAESPSPLLDKLKAEATIEQVINELKS